MGGFFSEIYAICVGGVQDRDEHCPCLLLRRGKGKPESHLEIAGLNWRAGTNPCAEEAWDLHPKPSFLKMLC